MQRQYRSAPYAHLVRIALTLVVLVVLGALVRPHFVPEGFGEQGYFRPGALVDEASRPVRNMSSESCYDCHREMKQLHVADTHATVSCEICHGPYADHVRDDDVIGTLPVARGEEIRTLCLRCHNRVTRALPPENIALVRASDHLRDLNVRPDHNCDQCHHVHAPMKWVREAREMVGFPPEGQGR